MRIGFAVALAAALAATPSLAIQRTFVASYGNDANACTLGAPCRSFTAALLKTSGFGEIIVLDSAGYGPVTIAKSVSIIAPQGIYAGVTVPSGDGITVNSLSAIVALRGLTINGQGTGGIGINIKSATRVNIEGCVISNMSSNGILDTSPGSQLTVLDTIVRSNGGTGIGIAADASVVVDHVRSEQNKFDGFYIVPGTTQARSALTDSLFAQNGGNGISVDSASGASTTADVERSTLSDNAANGLIVFGNAGVASVAIAHSAINNNAAAGAAAVSNLHLTDVTISYNTFVDNGVGISADGSRAEIWVHANSVASGARTTDFKQANGAVFFSYKDNVGTIGTSGTISPQAGQ